MGDGDHRLAFHQGIQALLNRRLDLRIQRRGGFVEHQDRRVLEQHPGDGDALPLPAGELHAPLADHRLEALAALAVVQGLYECVRAGLACRSPEFFFRGVGLAVAQVVADRTVQQRGVLGDHADIGAQAFLADLGNVLPVDEDAPAFQVIEAQQQVDQRRLTRTRRPDQADLLARTNFDAQATDHPALLAVVEMYVLEAHAALLHLQRPGVLGVKHIARPDDALHAVLHGADVLEDAVDHPHDPLGHVVDADHQAQRQGDGACGDQRLAPQPQSQRAGADDQQAVHAGDEEIQAGDHPRLQAELAEQLLHRLAGVALLLPGMGEQLERGDIAVAIHHPPHHLRTRRRRRRRTRADTRHEVPERGAVADDPQQQGHDQTQVGGGEQIQRTAGVNHHMPQRIDHLHGRIAQRWPGLHHALGDAPGEVVLEEVQALLEHVPMVLPADQIGQPRVDRLMGQQIVQAEHQRSDDQRHRRHPQQFVAVLGEEGPRVIGRLGHIDQLTEKAEQRHLDHRREKADHQHGRHQRPDLLQVMGVEAQHPGGRRDVRAGLEDIDQVFETAEQHGEVCFVARWANVVRKYARAGAASRLDAPSPGAFRQPPALPVDSHRWTSAALSTLRHSASYADTAHA